MFQASPQALESGAPVPRRPRPIRAAVAAACAAAILVGGPRPPCAAADEPPAAPAEAPAPEASPPPAAAPTPAPAAEPAARLPLIPTPAPAPSEARSAGRGLRAAGWTIFSLGAAATAVGLVLIPARNDELPLTTVIVPTLAAGAAAILVGRVLVSAGAQRRRGAL